MISNYRICIGISKKQVNLAHRIIPKELYTINSRDDLIYVECFRTGRDGHEAMLAIRMEIDNLGLITTYGEVHFLSFP